MKQCWLGHKWGKWEQYVWRGTVTYMGILFPKEQRGIPRNVEERRQKRTCERCGYMQEKVLSN